MKDFEIEDGVLIKYHGKDENVVIPEGVKAIKRAALSCLSKLKTITLPSTVSEIGAFAGCLELENIYVDENNKYFKSIDGVLYNKDCTKLVKYPMRKKGDEYIIPNGVVEISECGSFGENQFLKKISIPSGVTKIGKLSFHNCHVLEKVTIPKTVKEIGKSAFYNSVNLKNIDYEGSIAEWENIKIEENNECLTNATIYLNSTLN